MKTFRLLELLSLSHLRAERLKTALAFLGLTLGLALFVSIRLANENAWAGFADSVERIAPSTALRLVSDSGAVSENVIPAILNTPGVKTVSPLLIAYGSAESEGESLGQVQLVGIDPLGPGLGGKRLSFESHSDSSSSSATSQSQQEAFIDLLRLPNAAFTSERLFKAQSLSVSLGSREISILPRASLAGDGLGAGFGGSVILLDIAHLQDLLQRWDTLDALDIEPEDGVSPEAVKEAILGLSLAGLRFAEAGETEQFGRKMTEAFRLNLNFLASLSLLIALLLTYHAASFSILKRRKEFATVIAAGGSLRNLKRVVASEALLFGFAAALAGLALGRLIAGYTVSHLSGTINALYLPLQATSVSLPITLVLEALFLGPLLTLFASLLPLAELGRISPATAFGYQTYEESFRLGVKRLAIAGSLLLLLAAATARPSLLGVSPYLGLLSPAALLLAAICLSPLAVQWAVRLGNKLSSRLPAEVVLALDHIEQTLRRSSVAVAAMAVALAMYLGVSTLIVSFRETVERWIVHVTSADIYISPPGNIGSAVSGLLPEAAVKRIESDPELSKWIAEVDHIASRRVRLSEQQVRVNGLRFDLLNNRNPLPLIEESVAGSTEDRAGLAEVYLSESAAMRLRYKAGQRFKLPGLEREQEVYVRGIYYDYSSDQGIIILDSKVFEELFGFHEKQGISLHLQQGADTELVKARLGELFKGERIQVRDNRSLRAEVLRIFEQTFLITYALQFIALVISAVTLLNTLFMLLLERQREFSILRALGASRATVLRLVFSESLCLGGMALFGGVLLGALLALQLVFVVNRFYFGWSVEFTLPLQVLFFTVAGALAMSILAAIWPGKKAVQNLDGAVLRYE